MRNAAVFGAAMLVAGSVMAGDKPSNNLRFYAEECTQVVEPLHKVIDEKDHYTITKEGDVDGAYQLEALGKYNITVIVRLTQREDSCMVNCTYYGGVAFSGYMPLNPAFYSKPFLKKLDYQMQVARQNARIKNQNKNGGKE